MSEAEISDKNCCSVISKLKNRTQNKQLHLATVSFIYTVSKLKQSTMNSTK